MNYTRSLKILNTKKKIQDALHIDKSIKLGNGFKNE